MSAKSDTMYRRFAELRCIAIIVRYNNPAIIGICQSECKSDQPAMFTKMFSASPLSITIHTFLNFIQHFTDFSELRWRSPFRGQRLHYQLRRRAIEYAVENISKKLSLGLLLRNTWMVNMCSLLFVPEHQPLLRHYLQEFEHCRVSGRPNPCQRFEYIADRTGPSLP